MGWDRRAPQVMEVPAPPLLGRWLVAAGAALLAGVLLFLLHVSVPVPYMQALNIWAICAAPLLLWMLSFATRAYVYGRALDEYRFLEDEAQHAQQSWQRWAQRYLAVHASCVLLPDGVSANLLIQGAPDAVPRTGQARRIDALSAREVRAEAGLELLLLALQSTLQALPPEPGVRVTLLSDVEPGQHPALRDAWQRSWSTVMQRPQPEILSLVDELPYAWIDETLKSARASFELILVIQVQGANDYSDGLAAILLSPDRMAYEVRLPLMGRLSRPMPLDVDALKSELALFLQTQINAREATGCLADGVSWQPMASEILAVAATHGASLQLQQQWTQQRFCGLPGPFSHWLVTALGLEVARHQQRPLLVLTQDNTRHWISTVSTGESA